VQFTKQRATRPDEKALRRQQLLDAASLLLQATAYDNLTIAQIAEQAQLAKGTVYVYFSSKEALFLALTIQLLTDWFAELDHYLEQPQPLADRRQLAQALAQQVTQLLLARPLLLHLLGLLHTVLEDRADYQAILEFKRFLGEHLARTGALLEAALPGCATGSGVQALLAMHTLAIGMQHVTYQSETERQVIADHPHLAFGLTDFASSFAQAAEALLLGLTAAS
jgi:AcrR family transcriptional regulator